MQNWKALLKEPTWTAAEVFPGVDGSWIGGRTGGKGYKERQHQDPHLAHGEEALALAPHFALISVRQVIRQAGARRRSPGRRKRHFLQLEPGHQPRPPSSILPGRLRPTTAMEFTFSREHHKVVLGSGNNRET